MTDKLYYERTLPPLGINRESAAEYIGIKSTLFDELVLDGRMPPPRLINNRTVWDREEVWAAFKALPHRNEIVKKPSSGWDRVK